MLRAGRHVSSDDLDNHAFLSDFEPDLALFYQRYHTELVRAPEGFFYLRPRSTSLINRSVLSELDMLVGKVLCFLYLSPERLAHEGIFTNQELYDELLTLVEEEADEAGDQPCQRLGSGSRSCLKKCVLRCVVYVASVW